MKDIVMQRIEALEEALGLIVDTCDNVACAAQMPLPPAIHVEGLTGAIAGIKRRAQEALKS